MSKLQIIVGSARPGRAADLVAAWVIERSETHGGFEVEVLDLRDWQLPVFAETFGTMVDFTHPTSSLPIVRAWNQKLREGTGRSSGFVASGGLHRRWARRNVRVRSHAILACSES
jgi:NAD(P)H-dependent FMN reductase